ncbi:hypothetical protein NHG32_07080 [Aerococcaceae bacterium NML191219]|nr:hypothetical protein [Aerococcaceae bacterium NML191219]
MSSNQQIKELKQVWLNQSKKKLIEHQKEANRKFKEAFWHQKEVFVRILEIISILIYKKSS